MLRCGWTTIRIAGDADVGYAHLDVRRAIEEGLFDGPRIFGAGHYLSITGGGGDINFLPYDSKCAMPDGRIVDGVDQMIKTVREEIKYGSDWIKLLVTGAYMNSVEGHKIVHFSTAELDAAVSEANRLGVPVMAHAHSSEGIKAAVKAGARSIEHGTFIDEECISLMLERGTFLIPTFSVDDALSEGNHTFDEGHAGRIKKAVEGGVKIALGTDYIGWKSIRSNAKELIYLQKAGMTPMGAIRAATSTASELLRMQDKIGSIQVDKFADIIAVPGNPLEDLSVMQDVAFVMKGGKVIKS